jgi:hypothetical protein
VPADLAQAALRRAWVAGPAIRDFVGLAENAWDFTAPGGVPGFEPLRAIDDVRRLAAQVAGVSPAVAPEPAAGEQVEADPPGAEAAPQQTRCGAPSGPAPLLPAMVRRKKTVRRTTRDGTVLRHDGALAE